MHKIHHSALLPYSNEQLFDLVNDIESYPAFLPGCAKANITHQTETQIEATLELKKGPFSQAFSTRNALTKPTQIQLDLISGPFKSLSGVWSFEAVSEKGCQVTLDLEFTIANGILNRAFAKAFDDIANRMLQAFAQRAQEVYS